MSVEPTIAISALARLIGLGIKGWGAVETRGFDERDLAAIQSLLETGASFASMRKPGAPVIAAQHLALVARSFGQAVGRHQEFHGKLLLGGGLRRWLSRSERQRADEIALRVKVAALHPHGLGNDPRGEVDLVAALTASPLDTPYYRGLWRAFSDPGMTLPGEEPPLAMSHTVRREFERYFLLAYLAALESPAGRGVAAYLDGLQHYRAMLVRDLLVQDMAAWGGRHVFGNLPRERWTEGESVPFLPLDELYVEPDGVLEAPDPTEPHPLLQLLDHVTADTVPRVVVVVADFGSGKSLSARMFARRWAERALDTTSVSLDAVLPIYIRCSDDFPHDGVDLAAAVRRAWKRQADGCGLAIAEDDAAFAWPIERQRMVCLLDGLDEVALAEAQLKALLQRLRGKTTARHRFVVFSRPGALPVRTELGDSVVVIRIQPFAPAQVDRWIEGWNQLRREAEPVTLAAIDELGVRELVRTPILLFMIAFTWERHAGRRVAPSRAEIYESFFAQIATGKAAADRERHAPIAAASQALLAGLQNHGLLDERATLPDAMLWLMSRVAWEAQVLEQRRPAEPLTRRHIDNLLQDGDIRIPVEAVHAIEIGLVLALQADLRSADHRVLFGHPSFREFLVGRYWATQLHHVIRGSQREWDRRAATLIGGRLLGEANKSLDFLMQIVNAVKDAPRPTLLAAWTSADRQVLVRWAQEVFADEGQVFGGARHVGLRGEARVRDDVRAVLREAALAIGSLTRRSPGIRAPDPLTLRSMLAWFWLHRIPPVIVAPRAVLGGARLDEVQLDGADLDGANLDGANLDGAQLCEARLTGARLVGASLFKTRLDGARLDMAKLSKASLIGAKLQDAVLDGAALDEADLVHALLAGSRLVGASLARANLAAANLANTNLAGAKLEGANLEGANLEDADLRGARLTAANLERANLTEARLDGADLTRARLVRVDLTSANLSGATLEGACYDQYTIWPPGFDPVAHRAVAERDPEGFLGSEDLVTFTRDPSWDPTE